MTTLVESKHARRGTRAVIDPRTGEEIDSVGLLEPGAEIAVLQRATEVALSWAGTPVARRCSLVDRFAAELQGATEEVARTLCRENGKTLAEARTEVARAVDTLRWAADHGPAALAPQPQPLRAGVQREIRWESAGPALAIVAWNFPAVVLARKIGPALVAGCPVIVKGPEETPRTMERFIAAAERAGLPEDVIQLIFADPPEVQALLRHPGLGHVSFTGSSAVGRLVAATAATVPTACTLELGGHAPVVVTADADLTFAVSALARAKFSSAGQSCGAPSRFIVARPRYDEFVERFLAETPELDSVQPGDESAMGPLQSGRRRDGVHTLVTEAVASGASLLCGGSIPPGPGSYYPATVLADVPPTARILREEPFGPVAPIIAYDDDRAAVELANGTEYALSAYVFGSAGAALPIASRINAGCVSVNTVGGAAPDVPLGGRQSSGYGYEGGVEGIRSFCRLKTVQIG